MLLVADLCFSALRCLVLYMATYTCGESATPKLKNKTITEFNCFSGKPQLILGQICKADTCKMRTVELFPLVNGT